MRAFIAVLITASVATGAAACGTSEQQKAVDAAAKQLEETAQSAEKGDTAKSLQDVGSALGAIAGNPNQQPVEPVSIRDLQSVFPELEGWEKGKPTGEKMSTPATYSQAEVTYTKGESRLEARMVDSGFNQLIIGPIMFMMARGYERETEDGYEKSAKVAGLPGWERWNTESKSGEVSAVVGKRFILTIQGENIDDSKVLYRLAEKADFNGLPGTK